MRRARNKRWDRWYVKTDWKTNPRSFVGTASYNARTEPTIVTTGSWDKITAEFIAADTKLFEAATGMDSGRGYITPCRTDPNLWDSRSDKEGGSERGRPRRTNNPRIELTPYAVRVKKAAGICYTCRVFTQCLDLLATIDLNTPVVQGVFAGYLVDPTPGGDATRKALNMTLATDVHT